MTGTDASPEGAHPRRPAGCILAAGASRRLGRPKALVEIGERAVLQILTTALRELHDDAPIVVVTGAHDAEIRQHVRHCTDEEGGDVEVVHNRAWSRGRTGSVQVAREARPGRDLMVAPVDVPLVLASTVAALADEWSRRGAPEYGWLAPRIPTSHYLGHPVVIGRELLRRLDELDPSAPLTRLRDLAQPRWLLEVRDPAILDDLDTRADLLALRAAWRARNEPRRPGRGGRPTGGK